MNKTSSKPRRRGRPAATNDPNVRQRLVDTAEALFTAQGFAATSIRAIAEQAGVNTALVSYHFGGKHALLEAVFERALEPLAEALQNLAAGGSTPPEALLDLLYRMGREHPNLLPLLFREALLPGGAMHDGFVERFAPRLGGLFPVLLQREKDAGMLSEEVDPQALSILILAMGIFPHVAAPVAHRVLGMDMDAGGRERMLRQTTQLLTRGVKP